MAEDQGFEPWHTVTCLRAFQARPFSLLGNLPAERYLNVRIVLYQKNLIIHYLFDKYFFLE